MNRAGDRHSSEQEALKAYKSLLRDIINQRPSGTRKRIAGALGTHRSFISQVTNPGLKVPLPAQHVEPILRICHFSDDERQQFLQLYHQAHPGRPVSFSDLETQDLNVIRIIMPPFRSQARRADAEQLIREFATRIIDLSKNAE
ncbi:MAG TPA: hypothetical protein ENJ99_03610 [Rhizobiales bacterium]|nr:hypothetical protein [Hyphomicrobiales bacterium]